jgi:glycosyltransferase involved in cell wall biosynthesis
MTRISVLIPTIGRALLGRALASLLPAGLHPDDDVVVVGDVHDGPLVWAEEMCAAFGPIVRYVPFDAGHHCAAHCQINHVYHSGLFRGDIITMADDDDVWVRGALDRIRADAVAFPQKVLIYRFRVPNGLIVPPWGQDTTTLGLVSGQCIVTPNNPDYFGAYSEDYCGDATFVNTTCDRVGRDNVVFRPHLTVLGRPEDWREAWTWAQ